MSDHLSLPGDPDSCWPGCGHVKGSPYRTPTDPETPQTAAGTYEVKLTRRSPEAVTAYGDGYAAGLKAGRAARDAEVRALVDRWIAYEGYEGTVLHLLAILSDTPETGS